SAGDEKHRRIRGMAQAALAQHHPLRVTALLVLEKVPETVGGHQPRHERQAVFTELHTVRQRIEPRALQVENQIVSRNIALRLEHGADDRQHVHILEDTEGTFAFEQPQCRDDAHYIAAQPLARAVGNLLEPVYRAVAVEKLEELAVIETKR